jgi:hypothetical protein
MKKAATPASIRDLCLNHFQVLGIPIRPDELDIVRF